MILPAYFYTLSHILLCSYDDLQLDTADQQRINQLLNQRLEEQNLQNFGLRYLSRELRRQLTLIRMTKDEKGLAFFKGLLL